MTDRTVKVSLTAQVNNYVSAMGQAKDATTQFSEDAKQHFAEQKEAMDRVGTAALAFGALAAAGVALAVNKFAEFDAAMSNVQAATHESASNMQLLRAAAIEAGADTVFTATEAANAIEELAKAGVSTADILGGALAGALDLASAGELGVAEAAEIAATAMTQFKLKGSDVPHIADLLAAGAGKAQGSVQDLSAALKQSGLVAGQTGLTIEETTGGLAAFASAGLIGSDAGTSFKSMLQRLTPQSSEAAALMSKLGISAYDASGNFVGLEKFAGNLQNSLKGLTAEQRNSAMATIFGSDAVRAAAVLYDQGADGVHKWIDMVNDSGYAADTARQRVDNLNGDIEKLGGSFDSFLIKSGSGANGALRILVQGLTEVMDLFGDAPLFVQQTTLAIAAVAAAVALAGGAFLIGVPQVAAFNAALVTLGASTMPGVAAGAALITGATAKASGMLAATARFLTGPWGLALGAAGAAAILLNRALEAGVPTAEELTNALQHAANSAGLLRSASERSGAEKAVWGDYYDSLKDLPDLLDKIGNDGFDWLNLTFNQQGAADSIKRLGESLATLAASDLPAAQDQFSKLSDSYNLTEAQQAKLLDSMPAYKAALVEQANALGINVTSGSEAENQANLLALANKKSGDSALSSADSYLKAKEKTDALVKGLTDLLAAYNELNGINQDAESSNASWQSSLAGITEEVNRQREAYESTNGTLDGFSLSLDANTVAGSANRDMLAQVAAQSQGMAKDQLAADIATMGTKAATEKYIATLAQNKTALEQSAIAAGFSAAEVQALSDKVNAAPTQHEIEMSVRTAQAASQLEEFIDRASGRTITINLALNEHVATGQGGAGGITYADGAVVDYYADGGMRENHVAQIAPAGAYRVWAEQETGGESYIPLNPAKRARSLAIWSETGKRLGVEGFDDGGFSRAVSYTPANRYGAAPATTVTVNPVVSLQGATLQLTVDGRQMTAFVQDQIVQADTSNSMSIVAGVGR